METEIFTCKYFKFGRNTTGLSQSHLRNFLACSIKRGIHESGNEVSVNRIIELNCRKRPCRKNIFAVVVLQFDDSCYVDAKQYHLASFSTRNSTLNTSLRKPIRMQDFIQLCDPIGYKDTVGDLFACKKTSHEPPLRF